MEACFSHEHQHELRRMQLHPGFELGLLIQLPTTKTVKSNTLQFFIDVASFVDILVAICLLNPVLTTKNRVKKLIRRNKDERIY